MAAVSECNREIIRFVMSSKSFLFVCLLRKSAWPLWAIKLYLFARATVRTNAMMSKSTYEPLIKSEDSITADHQLPLLLRPLPLKQNIENNTVWNRYFQHGYMYFEFPVILTQSLSLGFALQSFTIGCFELPLFRTIFCFPWEFESWGSTVSTIYSCFEKGFLTNGGKLTRQCQKLLLEMVNLR